MEWFRRKIDCWDDFPLSLLARIPRRRQTVEATVHSSSYLLPAWDISIEARTKHRKQTVEALAARAAQVFGRREVTIRSLLASDLGLRSWRTPGQRAEQKDVWINHTIAHGQLIALCTVIQLSFNPKVSGLSIRMGHAGHATLGLVALDQLYSVLPILKVINSQRDGDWLAETYGPLENIRMEGYFSEPYFFFPGNTVYIQVDSFADNKKGDRLMLGGYVAEQVGARII